MKNNPIDEALVKRAQEGDKEAFNQLVIKYETKLLGVINHLIKDPTEALDVLQETFIKAYNGIEKFRGDSAFYSWIYRIAENAAKNHLAYLKRRPPQSDFSFHAAELNEPEAMSETTHTPEKQLAKHSASHQILQAFENLPKSLRQTLTLREIGGLTYAQIAQTMDIPIGTVRSRIARARTQLLRLHNK